MSPGSWLWLTVGALLATIPIWVATYPPMVDLPQHAAQIRALDELILGMPSTVSSATVCALSLLKSDTPGAKTDETIA